MEQPRNQQREGGGFGFGFAMGESSCHDDHGQALASGLCEVDGALLMELMEDPPSSDLLLDGDGDRQLSHVIRSLEAEIGGESGEAVVMIADDDGGESMDRIEDALSDGIDGYDYEGACASSFGCWPQVPSSLLLAGGYDEVEGWCVYSNNGYEGHGGHVLGYDDYYCCAEGSAEHMYLPLWE